MSKLCSLKNRVLSTSLLIGGVCLASLAFSTASFAAIVSKAIDIQVTSGSLAGETAHGVVKYDTANVKGVGEERINGTDITLHFTVLNQTIGGHDQLQIILSNGKFKDVYWGGPLLKNRAGEKFIFAMNGGFTEGQLFFARKYFGLTGASYFGYLSPDTYVDGYGTVTYSNA